MFYEDIFINNFIGKRYRERLKYELNNKQKRSYAINRFSHNCNDIIDKNKIHTESESLTIVQASEKLKELSSAKQAYIISLNSYDKQIMPFSEALAICFNEYSAVILIIDERTCFIKTEIEDGNCKKIIMYDCGIDKMGRV